MAPPRLMAHRIMFVLLLLEKDILDKNFEDPYYSSTCVVPTQKGEWVYIQFQAWSKGYKPGHEIGGPIKMWGLYSYFTNNLGESADTKEDNPPAIRTELNPPSVSTPGELHYRVRTLASRHKATTFAYFEKLMLTAPALYMFKDAYIPRRKMGSNWHHISLYNPIEDIVIPTVGSRCSHFSCTGYSKCVQGRTHARCVSTCDTLKCPENLRCFQRNYWTAAKCSIYPSTILEDKALYEIHIYFVIVLATLCMALTASCLRRLKEETRMEDVRPKEADHKQQLHPIGV